MSIKKISKIQPESFEFSKENLLEAENEIKKYPKDRKASAILALLFLAQKQNDNWIPLAAIKYVAKFLSLNSKLSGCSLAIFFILIYQFLQKLYPLILKQQEHLLTYDL